MVLLASPRVWWWWCEGDGTPRNDYLTGETTPRSRADVHAHSGASNTGRTHRRIDVEAGVLIQLLNVYHQIADLHVDVDVHVNPNVDVEVDITSALMNIARTSTSMWIHFDVDVNINVDVDDHGDVNLDIHANLLKS